jgi:hypothetical protein
MSDIINAPLFRRPDKVNEPLYVVATLFNATRWRSRWKLFQRFRKHVLDSGAKLCIVELAFGEREFVFTEDRDGWQDNEYFLQLRTNTELWYKENMINLGVQRFPSDWKYGAWVDGDVLFSRPDWADGTIQALQHYQWISPWSVAQDLDANFEPIQTHESFFRSYELGRKVPNKCDYYYGSGGQGKKNYFHPGFAAAFRREAFDAVGGMIDFAVLGAGDNHTANALIGQAEKTLPPGIHENYRNLVLEWQDRAECSIKRNVGSQRGLLLHYFHGAKVKRRYKDRWKILVENNFDPLTHLQRDSQGLWQFSCKAPIKLRDDIRKYFRQRDEDSGFSPDPV